MGFFDEKEEKSNCKHKWKIVKEFTRKRKNMLGNQLEETIYHLQCQNCGLMKTQVCEGFNRQE